MSGLGLKCTLSSTMANKFWSCLWGGLPLLVLLCSFSPGDTQLSCDNRPPPCLNGATCMNVSGDIGIRCLCSPDFMGTFCRDRVSNSSETTAASPTPPILPSTPPPTDSATCATNIAANIIWDTTPVGRTIERLCMQADPQLLDFRSMVRRTCNTGGVWGDPDFSECTFFRGTNAFLLVWFVVQSDSVMTVNNRRRELEEELSSALSELGAGTGLLPTRAVTNDTVLLTFRISFGVPYLTPSRQDEIRELLLTWLDDRSTLGNFTLVTNETSYQGFVSSDSCPCSATGDLFAEMCETRTPSGPCVCRDSTQCKCAQFYVGNGQRCTLDRDGDGYPDVALDTCNSTSAKERYCINDTCTGVYNPLQNSSACKTDESFNGCRSELGQFGIMWASTEFGETDTQLCPNGENFATRECGPRGWLRAAIQDCASFDFMNAREDALSALDRTGRNFRTRLQDSQAVTSNFRGITGPRMGLSLLPSDLNSTNLLLSGIVDLLDEGLGTGESDTSDQTFQDLFDDCADIFSNVLDGNNLDGWLELQEIDAGSQRLLDNAEQYGLYLSNAMNDTVGHWVWGRDNVVFGSSRSNPEESTTFPESLDDLANTSFTMIPAQITIPARFLMERRGANARTVPVTTILFQNMETVLPSNVNGSRVASMVLSTQVRMRRGQSDALVQEPVSLSFTFEADENVSEYRCAYWEFSDPIGDGSWAFDGIEMVSSTTEDGMTTVNCTSTHLTSFAVLVDVSGVLSNDGNDTISAGELVALQIVSYIGCAISIICLIATIIFFLSMGKQLFTSVHYFIHLNLAISLCLGYLVFVTSVQPARANDGACIFIAALLHYLFLAVFSWMLCEGIMLYLMLVVVFSRLIRKWWLFLFLGYGLPVIPVAVTVGVRTSDYGVTDTDGNLTFCWLSTDNGVIWAFVAPMLAIITVNVFFLCLALATVYRSIHAKIKRKNHDSKFNESYELFKPLFKATIVLLPILGLTWVLGLFAINENTTVFAWLFTICNSLQGVFIFVFHVLRSEKVWQSSHAKFLRDKASSTFRSTIRTSTTGTMVKKPPTSYARSTSTSTDDTKMIATSTAKGIELGAAGTWNSTADRQELDIEEGITDIDAKESQTITECRKNTSDTHLDTESGSS